MTVDEIDNDSNVEDLHRSDSSALGLWGSQEGPISGLLYSCLPGARHLSWGIPPRRTVMRYMGMREPAHPSLLSLKRQSQRTVTGFLSRYEEAGAGAEDDGLTAVQHIESDRRDDWATPSRIDQPSPSPPTLRTCVPSGS